MRHHGNIRITLPSIILLLSSHALGASFFFDRTGGLGPGAAPISNQCYAALNASIACEGSLLTFMTSDSYAPIGNKTLQDQFCAAGCGTALTSYQRTVVSAWANDPQPSQASQPSTGLMQPQLLLSDCTNLLLGQVLCVPFTCQTYTVQPGDTCDKIAASHSVTFQQIAKTSASVPPGGAVSLTTIKGATATQTAIYATTTVAPPGPAASGTTRDCGKWYLVQPGDFCQLVALNKTIDLGLFLSINPSLDSSCSNLLAGMYYYVQPTADWNSTTTSTVVSPPAPTPPGSTPECYGWYVVKSGDYCSLIENDFGITMAQLQLWNPSLKADCSNLFLGEAYCVHGAQQPDGFARAADIGRRWPPAVATGTPDSGSGSLVDTLVRRFAGLKARRPPGPAQTEVPTPPVGGGVPRGWPGLNSPRMAMGEGAKVPVREEL